jgi:hypothetical protein
MIPKRSEELRQTILGSPALLKALSEKVADVLGDSVALPENTTYVFVPRVYSRPTFWPEVYATASVRERIPFGGAGPLDPEIAKVMDSVWTGPAQPATTGSAEPAASRLPWRVSTT